MVARVCNQPILQNCIDLQIFLGFIDFQLLHTFYLILPEIIASGNRVQTNKKCFYIDLMSYASPPIQKLHSCDEVTSKTYKPAFHSSYLSHNTSYGSTATIQVFCLLWWRYSYSVMIQSSRV